MTIDTELSSFPSYFLRKLRRVAHLYKGTNMGGFLQGAYYHLETTQGALNDSDEHADELRKENADMRAQLEAIAAHIQGIDKLCATPVMGFETIAKDQSGFINCMAAHGVEPYSKRVKGWRSDKKKIGKPAIPPMEFVLGGAPA